MSFIDACVGLPSHGTPLLIAVSGGADSMALLDVLRCANHWPLCVFHLDHQLRADSDQDAALVRAYCERYGIPAEIDCADIKQCAAEQGLGIEEAARQERYQRLQRIAEHRDIAYIVTAHHRDDQIETVVMNIFRGAAASGLAGMLTKRRQGAIYILRPCLQIPRQEMRTYAKEHDVPWREDSSNNDTQYRRNFIRHTLIPEFEAACPGFGEELLKRAAQERQRVDKMEQELKLYVNQSLQDAAVSLEVLAAWERAQRAQFFRSVIIALAAPLSRLHIQRLEALWQGENSKRLQLGNIEFIKNPAALIWQQCGAPEDVCVDFSDSIQLNGYIFSQEDAFGINPKALPSNEACVNAEAIKGTLRLRTIMDGERWQPLGAPGSKSLMSYLSDRKFPVQQRGQLIVCADDAGVIWVPGFTIAERVRAGENDPVLLLGRVEL